MTKDIYLSKDLNAIGVIGIISTLPIKSSIFFYLVSILLKTIFISHSKNVENRDVEKGERIRPYRTRETLFLMEVEG